MDEYYFIKMTKDDKAWILYRDGKFSGYTKEIKASRECTNLLLSSEFAADFSVCKMNLDELKVAVGIPYNVYDIRAGLVKLEGVLLNKKTEEV